MDPQANIKRQRELAANIIGRVDAGPHVGQSEEDHRYQLDAEADELAELVLALDEWRRKGGFDPYSTNSRRVLEAMRSIVDYNWADEEEDYAKSVRVGDIEPAPGSGHVYEALTIVSAFLTQLEGQE
jgi:hypothetical protein